MVTKVGMDQVVVLLVRSLIICTYRTLTHRHKWTDYSNFRVEADMIEIWYEACKCGVEREWYRW